MVGLSSIAVRDLNELGRGFGLQVKSSEVNVVDKHRHRLAV